MYIQEIKQRYSVVHYKSCIICCCKHVKKHFNCLETIDVKVFFKVLHYFNYYYFVTMTMTIRFSLNSTILM